MSNVKTDLQIAITNIRKNSNQHKKCENCEVILMNLLHVKSDPKLFDCKELSFYLAYPSTSLKIVMRLFGLRACDGWRWRGTETPARVNHLTDGLKHFRTAT